ncbi:hypothetical protein J5J10_10625 [Ciceribacter sp. L1K23]|uniref:hypothetical protein n=1 Tax=unclassified Ciceribacter TaxID=2628820 RepID=UPI001ABE4E56|nr:MULTISPECIES: hypothetical protein [unclassified Ciceribacter]MBO3759713.1 hypothetical protein [Ciceribacter sp. L1K22]MBR0556131.1 hypothetical protein [Ciceribacter sp. L1K23]
MTFTRAATTVLLVATMALSTTGCQREDEGPLAVSGRIFIFNYRVAEATYVLTLARKGELPDESVIETSFENPAGGPPLVTHTRISPTWEKIALESPAVHCIVRDRPYAVSIRISDGNGKPIQTIETSVTSSLDQTILPAKPLVVGPVYTPNPEVYPGDGTADYSPARDCPAVDTST